MVNQYRITPRATEDITGIARYSREKWGADQQRAYISDLFERFQWLADNPRLGAERKDIGEDYRSFPHRSHIVYYTILDERTIAILGVLHQRADVLRHFPADDIRSGE